MGDFIKKSFFIFVIFSLSFLLLILLGEVMVRLSGIPQLENYDNENGEFLRFNKPNFHGLRRSSEFNNKFYLNKFGLRGKELDFQKQKDAYRIVCLGDSFTLGLQLPLKDIYPSLVEAALKKESKNSEVLILSGEGIGASLEYLYLRKIGLKFHPDLVVLALFFNDVDDDWRDREKLIVDDAGCPLGPRPFKKYVYTIWDKSELYRFQKQFIKGLKTRHKNKINPQQNNWKIDSIQKNKFSVLKDKYSTEDLEAFNNSFNKISCINNLCKQNNIRFVLMLIPPGIQVNAEEWRKGKASSGFNKDDFIKSDAWQQQVKTFCQNNQISVLDLLPILRAQSKGDGDLYFSYDGHWTAKGHKVAAEALEGFLKKSENQRIIEP